MELILMRHGRSLADDENKFEGRYDSPLTDVGRQQAFERAEKLRASGLKPDLVIASTLVRAAETGKILAQALGSPFETDPDWMEMNNGPLAGLTYEEGNACFPQPAFRNPYEPFHGSGESDWQIYCRAARAVDNIVRRGLGCVLVVAHGGILNASLRTIAGAQPPVNGDGLWFAFNDTGYARLTYTPDKHVWVLRELGKG